MFWIQIINSSGELCKVESYFIENVKVLPLILARPCSHITMQESWDLLVRTSCLIRSA